MEKIINKEFTHIDKNNLPSMVDVGEKKITQRFAHAKCEIHVPQIVFDQLKDGEIQSKKGPVFQTAIIAGTMAVKSTSTLIPFCHPLNIESIKITIDPMTLNSKGKIVINSKVKVSGKTGVEMEALTGATVTALTIYDMCKALTQKMVIGNAHLVEKTGGKTHYKRDELC